MSDTFRVERDSMGEMRVPADAARVTGLLARYPTLRFKLDPTPDWDEEIVTALEDKYGQAERVWVMDRGMVSEENIEFLRERKARYLVGTPKGGCPNWRSTSSRCPGRPCAKAWT